MRMHAPLAAGLVALCAAAPVRALSTQAIATLDWDGLVAGVTVTPIDGAPVFTWTSYTETAQGEAFEEFPISFDTAGVATGTSWAGLTSDGAVAHASGSADSGAAGSLTATSLASGPLPDAGGWQATGYATASRMGHFTISGGDAVVTFRASASASVAVAGGFENASEYANAMVDGRSGFSLYNESTGIYAPDAGIFLGSGYVASYADASSQVLETSATFASGQSGFLNATVYAKVDGNGFWLPEPDAAAAAGAAGLALAFRSWRRARRAGRG